MKKILLYLFLILVYKGFSQQIYFDYRYAFNPISADLAGGVIILDSNNYIVAGVEIDSTYTFQRIAIMEIDIHGVIQWKKAFN